jgi:Recombinase
LSRRRAKFGKLGEINGTRQASAVARAQAIASLLAEWGGKSARAAAAELNARGIETPTGAPWSAKTVIRARERLAAL